MNNTDKIEQAGKMLHELDLLKKEVETARQNHTVGAGVSSDEPTHSNNSIFTDIAKLEQALTALDLSDAQKIEAYRKRK